MADFNATSASNARPRRRHREAGADMMETDVDSGSSHMTHRTGTSGQATTGLGAGQTEIRMEKAREFLNMVKTIAAKQPEIEKEFDALEMMVSRSASVKVCQHLSRVMRKPTFWFPTWSDTNQAV